MSNIRELATVAAKGQITLPMSIRHTSGSMSVPGWHSNSTMPANGLSRADTEHEDPAIGAFLVLLADDIRAGRHVGVPQGDLARDMLEHAQSKAEPDEDINGEVDL